ncbi:Uncharacterised protein [Yersinia aleksiciae]|nr:Uncharacterised protein [Yersinia aleksiciae]
MGCAHFIPFLSLFCAVFEQLCHYGLHRVCVSSRTGPLIAAKIILRSKINSLLIDITLNLKGGSLSD